MRRENQHHNNHIAILDFGGQYAHLIATRIRQLGVKSVIRPANSTKEDLQNFAGIILSGGPLSVSDTDSPLPAKEIFSLNIPIMGICYGHQAMCKVLGGTIQKGETKEYGYTELEIDEPVGILSSFEQKSYTVWSSHWDEVTQLPEGFKTIGHSKDSPHIAIADEINKRYGIQFHAEVTHTAIGQEIFQNFINLTGAEKTWSMEEYQKEMEQKIHQQVDESGRKVFMLVSGGVDSVVGFSLLNKVLGEEKVYGMLVDTGFMRKNEIEEVTKAFDALGWHNLHVYDAKQEFFDALKEVYDPEEKRHIIGKKFVEIQARAISELGLDADHWLLGQGTIYPDTIESGVTKHADKIKTHHNRVPEIMEMMEQGLVIEPLADLYKDEVRLLGEQLGLPHHLVWRHPFPGPGLAIRCLCTKTNKVESRDFNTEEEEIKALLKKYNLTGTILPIRSVGVQGDARTYKHPLLVQGAFNWNQEELQQLSTSLTNTFETINRVLLDLSPNPTSEHELIAESDLNPERISLLQEADKIVMDEIEAFDAEDKVIWQCPTILLPLSSRPSDEGAHGGISQKKESIVIRPFSSKDVMSANFALFPQENIQNVVQKLSELNISGILYDITNKPPGTIEWE